jgi:hypothetical protein
MLNPKIFVDIARKDRANFSIRQVKSLKIIKFVRFLSVFALAQRLTIYMKVPVIGETLPFWQWDASLRGA